MISWIPLILDLKYPIIYKSIIFVNMFFISMLPFKIGKKNRLPDSDIQKPVY